MNDLRSLTGTVCCICVAVSIFSMLIPQKRTRKVMSFVIGLFFIGTLLSGIITQARNIDLHPALSDEAVPEYDEQTYNDLAAQMTADNVTASLYELLSNEGITVTDIHLQLKISDEGRIYAASVVIYIDETSSERVGDVKNIVYRNIAKEPEVYVTEREVQ